MGRGLWIALLLLLIAILSWWLLLRSTEPGPQSIAVQALHQPDYYMEQFELTSLDELGVPAHKLYADNMFHYPDDDSATLKRPHLIVFLDENEFWDIRAESGRVLNGGKSVLMQGEVTILLINPDNPQVREMLTTELTVRPHDKYAETAEAVTFNDGDDVTHAVGMWADLNERKIELMSKVRGSYAPRTY